MDAKTAELFTKLMLDGDEGDVVYFSFKNDKRKVKSSISMLAEISPVFEVMFSTRWHQDESALEGENLLLLESFSQNNTIELDDDVTFNQYLTFKLFMQMLYGLRRIDDTLSVEQATGAYFYARKYQIEDVESKIQQFVNKRMESGIKLTQPFTVIELKEGLEFAQLYSLDEFKNKLEYVKLQLDEENTIQFWDLVNKFEMSTLKLQVAQHLKTVPPKQDWPVDLLLEIVGCLQQERKEINKTCSACDCEFEVTISSIFNR